MLGRPRMLVPDSRFSGAKPGGSIYLFWVAYSALKVPPGQVLIRWNRTGSGLSLTIPAQASITMLFGTEPLPEIQVMKGIDHCLWTPAQELDKRGVFRGCQATLECREHGRTIFGEQSFDMKM